MINVTEVKHGVDKVSVFSDVNPEQTEIEMSIPNDKELWLQEGKEIVRRSERTNWDYGDWWNKGHKYGDRKEIVSSDDWDGPSFQSLMDMCSVARQFEISRRREVLLFSHHREVLGLPTDVQDKLLDEAEERGLGHKKLRLLVKSYKEEQKKTHPEDPTHKDVEGFVEDFFSEVLEPEESIPAEEKERAPLSPEEIEHKLLSALAENNPKEETILLMLDNSMFFWETTSKIKNIPHEGLGETLLGLIRGEEYRKSHAVEMCKRLLFLTDQLYKIESDLQNYIKESM